MNHDEPWLKKHESWSMNHEAWIMKHHEVWSTYVFTGAPDGDYMVQLDGDAAPGEEWPDEAGSLELGEIVVSWTIALFEYNFSSNSVRLSFIEASKAEITGRSQALN